MQCVLVLAMGTSLKVQPVELILELVLAHCPRVLFIHELVGDFDEDNWRDVFEPGDCNDRYICNNWKQHFLCFL